MKDRSNLARQRESAKKVAKGAASLTSLFRGSNIFEDSVCEDAHEVNFRFWMRFINIMRVGLEDDAVSSILLFLSLGVAAVLGLVQGSYMSYLGGPVTELTMEYLYAQENVYPSLPSFGYNQSEAGYCSFMCIWSIDGNGAPVTRLDFDPKYCLKEQPRQVRLNCLSGPLWDTDAAGPTATEVNGSLGDFGVAYSYLFFSAVIFVANVVIALLGSILVARVRRRVTEKVHAQLFSERTHYRLVMNDFVDNYDQRLTDDFQQALDFALGRMTGSILITPGIFATMWLVVWSLKSALDTMLDVSMDAWILPTFIASAIGALLVALAAYLPLINRVASRLFHQQRLEGELRWHHSRIVVHCEGVASMGGEQSEEALGQMRFLRIYDNSTRLFLLYAVLYGLQVFFQTIGSAMGFLFLFLGRFAATEIYRLSDMFQNVFKNLLLLPLQYQLFSVAAGPIHRVGELMEAVDKIYNQHQNVAQLTVATSVWDNLPSLRVPCFQAQNASAGTAVETQLLRSEDEDFLDNLADPFLAPMASGMESSDFTEDEPAEVELRSVSAAPPGAPELLLFASLSLCVMHGLLRVIAGLWEVQTGRVRRPTKVGRGGILFVPQRPYTISNGSLRAQVTYPNPCPCDGCEFEGDDELEHLLRFVGLGELLEAWGLDSAADWRALLSTGEMQQLGFARVLYNRPSFALMDEATSACDALLEAQLLHECNVRQITMIAVCHRSSAVGFHENILRYTGSMKIRKHDPSAWTVSKVSDCDKIAAARVAADASRQWKKNGVNKGAEQKVAAGEDGKSAGEDVDEDNGINEALFRRLRLIASLAFTVPCEKEDKRPWWLGNPMLCLYALFLGHVGGAASTIAGTRVAGYLLAGFDEGAKIGYSDKLVNGVVYMFINTLLAAGFGFLNAFIGQILSLHVRKATMFEAHVRYFSPKVAYTLNKIDRRCDTCDQRIQMDLQKLQKALADSVFGSNVYNGVYGSSIRLLVLLGYGLNLSWFASSVMLAMVMIGVVLSIAVASLVGRAYSVAMHTEGTFRRAHARLREFSESVAFYGGARLESKRVAALLDSGSRRVPSIYTQQLNVVSAFLPTIIVTTGTAVAISALPTVVLSYQVFFVSSTATQLTFDKYSGSIAFFLTVGISLSLLTSAVAGLGTVVALVHRVGALLEACDEIESEVFDAEARNPPPRNTTLAGGAGAIELHDLGVVVPTSTSQNRSAPLLRHLSVRISSDNGSGLVYQ